MRTVVKLVTVADASADAGPRRMSVTARLEAVLDDGRRVVLLDDRGFTSAPSDAAGDHWAGVSDADIVHDARIVVGPDEPVRGETPDQVAAAHWGTLAERLRARGAAVDADDLRRLPHEVRLTSRLRRLLEPPPRRPA